MRFLRMDCSSLVATWTFFLTSALTIEMISSESIYCRDSWISNITLKDFVSFSCAKCFVQVFFNHKPLTMHLPATYPYLLYHRNTSNVTYSPDPDASRVCSDYLTEAECNTWRSCCQSAKTCCLHQQQMTITDEPSCPPTWDGVSCWPPTPGGATAHQQCPQYYMAPTIGWNKPEALRKCDSKGIWEMHPLHKNEISNYTMCFDTTVNSEIVKIGLYIDFIGNGVSVIFLLFAIIFLLSSRSLRLELSKRISLQLHMSLFLAVLFNGIFTILFHLVYLDAFSNPDDPVYMKNSIWCRTLHAITKFFKSATFLGMLCEGLYLFRRILNVLQVGLKESLTKYLLIGWLAPAAIVCTYVIVCIALNKNGQCWIEEDLSHLEFIHVVPNLLSLICNLFFLISIEWMLCTKMRSDTSDKRIEVLRNALRATLSLIPIFGLQFLFIIWRPRHWPPYEIIVALFTSTQGFLVAVLYCFATQEVKEEAQRLYTSLLQKHKNRPSSIKMSVRPPHIQMSRVMTQMSKVSCGLLPLKSDHEKCRKDSARVTQMTYAMGSITPPSASSLKRRPEDDLDQNVPQVQESLLKQKHVVEMHSCNGRVPHLISQEHLAPILESSSLS